MNNNNNLTNSNDIGPQTTTIIGVVGNSICFDTSMNDVETPLISGRKEANDDIRSMQLTSNSDIYTTMSFIDAINNTAHFASFNHPTSGSINVCSAVESPALKATVRSMSPSDMMLPLSRIMFPSFTSTDNHLTAGSGSESSPSTGNDGDSIVPRQNTGDNGKISIVRTGAPSATMAPGKAPKSPHFSPNLYPTGVGSRSPSFRNSGRSPSCNSYNGVSGRFCTFDAAKSFAQSLKLKSKAEWKRYCVCSNGGIASPSMSPMLSPALLPTSISTHNLATYIDDNEHSSSNNNGSNVKPITDVIGLSSVTSIDFTAGIPISAVVSGGPAALVGLPSLLPARPPHIPSNPDRTYRSCGWRGWGDFLGTGNVRGGDSGKSRETFVSFEVARQYAQSLSIRTQMHWWQFCGSEKRPSAIPFHPDLVYRNEGWVSWRDFLGNSIGEGSGSGSGNDGGDWDDTGPTNDYVISSSPSLNRGNDDDFKLDGGGSGVCPRFSDTSSLLVASSLGGGQGDVSSYSVDKGSDLFGLSKLSMMPPPPPPPLPSSHSPLLFSSPSFSAVNGGGGRSFLSFVEAREFCRGLGLRSQAEWTHYCRGDGDRGQRPPNIPSHPDRTYKQFGWIGWHDFLNIENNGARPRVSPSLHAVNSVDGAYVFSMTSSTSVRADMMVAADMDTNKEEAAEALVVLSQLL